MWLIYAVVAVLCFAGMQLLLKQLTRMGLASPVLLAFLFAFATLMYLGHAALQRQPMVVSTRALLLLLAAAACSYAGNLYMVRSLAVAPNPGYAVAVVGLQALPVTFAALVLFGSELTWVKALGVFLSIAGVALLTVDG